MNIRHKLHGLVYALSVLTMAVPAVAHDKYPDRPMKVVVALPAGGEVDMIARLVGQRLATEVGQPFVVDNQAGMKPGSAQPASAASSASMNIAATSKPVWSKIS